MAKRLTRFFLLKTAQILQEEEDISEIVQLVGKVITDFHLYNIQCWGSGFWSKTGSGALYLERKEIFKIQLNEMNGLDTFESPSLKQIIF